MAITDEAIELRRIYASDGIIVVPLIAVAQQQWCSWLPTYWITIYDSPSKLLSIKNSSAIMRSCK